MVADAITNIHSYYTAFKGECTLCANYELKIGPALYQWRTGLRQAKTTGVTYSRSECRSGISSIGFSLTAGYIGECFLQPVRLELLYWCSSHYSEVSTPHRPPSKCVLPHYRLIGLVMTLTFDLWYWIFLQTRDEYLWTKFSLKSLH